MGQSAPLLMGKRKRTSQDEDEKSLKKVKVEAAPSTIIKKDDAMVSKEICLGASRFDLEIYVRSMGRGDDNAL